MFGDTSAISIIELKNLKAFMHGLLGSPESLKPGDVTIVYSKWKVSLEELGKELPNINEYGSFFCWKLIDRLDLKFWRPRNENRW